MNAILLFIHRALYPFRVLKNWMTRIPALGGFSVRLTLAGKVAWSFGLCLSIAIVVCFFIYLLNEQSFPQNSISKAIGWNESDTRSWLGIDYILYFLLGLVAASLLYWGIRFATLEMPSLYPEIDRCWDAVEKWRDKEKLRWDEFERFLVLGADLDTAKVIHGQKGDKEIGPLPSANKEWMHWFGNSERLYLHGKKTSCLAEAITQCRGDSPTSSGRGVGSGTLMAGNSMHFGMDTQNPDQWESPVETQEPDEPGSGIHNVTADPFDSGAFDANDDSVIDDSKAQASSEKEEVDSLVSFDDDDDQPLDRIAYLSTLALKRVDGNLPFEGVLVVIPFLTFLDSKNFKLITEALRADLEVLQAELNTSIPVMILFSSMEMDLGFPKLQSLMGEARYKEGRFGAGGAKPLEVPEMTQKTVGQAVERTVTSFESWVFNRWGKPKQLSSAHQNIELYKLLIRVRKKFRPHLSHLLEEAFMQPSKRDSGTPIIFGGCYFASTGKSPTERGFIEGVLAKCGELGQIAGWGSKSLDSDRFYSVAASLLFIGSLAIVGILSWQFWQSLAS